MKRKVTLKFLGSGVNNKFQPYIKIYDKNKCLIYSCYSYNGIVKLCLNTNSYYYINARLCSNIISKVIYVNNYNTNYVFAFNNTIINKQRLVTFLLTDSNYLNLPIENGKVMLWQRQ